MYFNLLWQGIGPSSLFTSIFLNRISFDVGRCRRMNVSVGPSRYSLDPDEVRDPCNHMRPDAMLASPPPIGVWTPRLDGTVTGGTGGLARDIRTVRRMDPDILGGNPVCLRTGRPVLAHGSDSRCSLGHRLFVTQHLGIGEECLGLCEIDLRLVTVAF